MPIEIKFVSKLAQIQQAADTGAMEITLAMAGRMEAAMPGTLDNFNIDRFIRSYGEDLISARGAFDRRRDQGDRSPKHYVAPPVMLQHCEYFEF